MQCFAPNECSEWLRKRDIIESPYSRNVPVRYQFAPPEKSNNLRAFTRSLFAAFGEFSGALVVFNDWALYSPDEMALIISLRRAHGEQRWLIHAPGHLFGPTEEAEAIGNCYLAVMFGWSAYLYPESGAATVLFWEGDLVDFWSRDDNLTASIHELTTHFKLRVTGGYSEPNFG